MQPNRAIIIPGNGCDEGEPLDDVMWYGWLARALRRDCSFEVPLRPFPDPLYAHERVWKKFARESLGIDERTVIVGHSSGAVCALRLMEECERIGGCVLVSAYDNDLGDAVERESGYFGRPFDYERMRTHTPWIVQFHSTNDRLVPVACARRIAEALQSDYYESTTDGHFQCEAYPRFVEAVRLNMAKAKHAA